MEQCRWNCKVDRCFFGFFFFVFFCIIKLENEYWFQLEELWRSTEGLIVRQGYIFLSSEVARVTALLPSHSSSSLLPPASSTLTPVSCYLHHGRLWKYSPWFPALAVAKLSLAFICKANVSSNLQLLYWESVSRGWKCKLEPSFPSVKSGYNTIWDCFFLLYYNWFSIGSLMGLFSMFEQRKYTVAPFLRFKPGVLY